MARYGEIDLEDDYDDDDEDINSNQDDMKANH